MCFKVLSRRPKTLPVSPVAVVEVARQPGRLSLVGDTDYNLVPQDCPVLEIFLNFIDFKLYYRTQVHKIYI